MIFRFMVLNFLFLINVYSTEVLAKKNISTKKLNKIQYLDGMYIAIGNDGEIKVSADFMNWETSKSNSTKNLTDICKSQGKYIIVGDSGTILFSSNGKNWESNSNSSMGNLLSAACTDSFFISNSEKSVFYSRMGGTWDSLPIAESYRGILSKIMYRSVKILSNEIVVLVDVKEVYLDCLDGSCTTIWRSKGGYFSSTDLLKWNYSKFDFPIYNRYLFENKEYILSSQPDNIGENHVGLVKTRNSKQNTEWSNVFYGSNQLNLVLAKDLCFSGNQILGLGKNLNLISSQEGDSWVVLEFSNLNSQINDVIWDGKSFKFVGDSGYVFEYSRNNIPIKTKTNFPKIKIIQNGRQFSFSGFPSKSGPINLFIYDYSGKLVMKILGYSKDQIITLPLSSGMYVSKFQNNLFSQIHPFFIP